MVFMVSKDVENNQLKNVNKVYSFWGKHPSLYNFQDIVTFFGRAETVRKKAVEKMQLKKGNKVLEVACGTGSNFQYLVETVGNKGFILGLDYVQDSINSAKKLAEKNNWRNIKVVQGDAAELKIQENNFDGVICVLGMSAIPSWEKALKRCCAVLKPGARLVVCDACLFSNFLKFLNPLVELIYTKFAAWVPNRNIPEKMKDIFENVEIETINLGAFFIAVSVKKK